ERASRSPKRRRERPERPAASSLGSPTPAAGADGRRLMRIFGKRPFLTAAADGVIARVRDLDVALALVARPASGAYGVARAIHRDGRPEGFVAVRTPLAGDRTLAA